MGNVGLGGVGSLSQGPLRSNGHSLGGHDRRQLNAHTGALPWRGLHLDHGANALGPLAHDAHAHVQHILRKLGLSSRVQAAVYASDRQRAE